MVAAATSGYGSVAGASRTTARPAARAAAATSPTGAGSLRRGGGAGRRATTRSGDAVRRNDAGRPAHRHAAQSASSRRSAVGPRPDHLANGLSATPTGGATSRSVTHAPTRRPARATRTRSPTCRSPMPSGTM